MEDPKYLFKVTFGSTLKVLLIIQFLNDVSFRSILIHLDSEFREEIFSFFFSDIQPQAYSRLFCTDCVKAEIDSIIFKPLGLVTDTRITVFLSVNWQNKVEKQKYNYVAVYLQCLKIRQLRQYILLYCITYTI